ncbi:HAMP domain-containing sensor histidine kinase [Roseateles sp.]|uniref:sensor histidine kinase n=1 Tax=Roseateles sp. TaxID=1971397 RepID=UPI003264E831
MKLGFSARLSLALVALLCSFGAGVALVGARALETHQQETLQRLSQGLARHIVEHWPGLNEAQGGDADRRSLDAVLDMLMVVNPAIEVYLLEADGRVRAYLGDPQAVHQSRVALAPVQAFLDGAPLPLRGTDPRTPAGHAGKIFSAARFPASARRAPGYLYVVLEGQAAAQIAGSISHQRLWQGGLLMLGVALLATLVVGLSTLMQLTRPLRRLALRMQAYRPGDGDAAAPPQADEVRAIEQAFERMAARIERQTTEQADTQAAHREVVANVAHDLRTPLTALHGHLEALLRELPEAPPAAQRHLRIALDQSDKVRRLSQQLFELASLQSSQQIAHVECFRLDELVTDAVQKFSFAPGSPSVALAGPPPGPLVLKGDLQLVERALTNLIDNALRHAPDAGTVQVSVQRDAAQVSVVIEDQGPGLPTEVRRRLDAGLSLREPPISRPGGGFGGLGLAIAQRIAQLHGGSLSTRPASHGGTVLCLALPLAA